MTKTATFFGTAGLMTVAMLTVYGTGCSSDDTTGDAGTGTTASAAFRSNCQRCHGAEGAGAGRYPAIPGSKATSEADFIALVRAGVSGTEMSAYSSSQISDADLKSDYAFLKSKR